MIVEKLNVFWKRLTRERDGYVINDRAGVLSCLNQDISESAMNDFLTILSSYSKDVVFEYTTVRRFGNTGISQTIVEAPAPGRFAVVVVKDNEDGDVWRFTFPQPLDSAIIETAAGERILPAVVDVIVGAFATMTGRDLGGLYGYVAKKVVKSHL